MKQIYVKYVNLQKYCIYCLKSIQLSLHSSFQIADNQTYENLINQEVELISLFMCHFAKQKIYPFIF